MPPIGESVRWYLGYDFHEPLPDHSSLTRIRERYGVEVFRRFFEEIVDQCQQAGLIWGKELYADATKVQANAALSSLKPRFAVEAHLEKLFAPERPQEHRGDVDALQSEVSLLEESAPRAEMPPSEEQGVPVEQKTAPAQLHPSLEEALREE